MIPYIFDKPFQQVCSLLEARIPWPNMRHNLFLCKNQILENLGKANLKQLARKNCQSSTSLETFFSLQQLSQVWWKNLCSYSPNNEKKETTYQLARLTSEFNLFKISIIYFHVFVIKANQTSLFVAFCHNISLLILLKQTSSQSELILYIYISSDWSL